MPDRIYNFSPGPATLPVEVLQQAAMDIVNYNDKGIGLIEMSHRSKDFMAITAEAEELIRELLNVPRNYKVLFLQGGASTQFAMVPINLLQPGQQAGYLITGVWSQMAFKEAQRLKNAYQVATTEHHGFTSIPDYQTWNIQKNTSYLYYCPNETVNGVRFPFIPESTGIPLIADITSCMLSEPLEIEQYGLVFAGVQKNIANAGLTIVVVREDLLIDEPNPVIPSMLNYKLQAEHHSVYATPPVFNCYLAAIMFDWIKEQGGVAAIYQQNCQKAGKLYQFLDGSEFYTTSVEKKARSIVNVCFDLQKKNLTNQFLVQAEQRGLYSLSGHRKVGGFRASLYNAMPMAGVDALIEFMSDFAQENNR